MHGDRREIKSILLIRLGGLGDVVFTLPAVNAIKSAFPNARVAYLVYKEFAPVLAGFPAIDAVLELDRAQYRQFNLKMLSEALGMLKELRRGRFDLTIDFQGFGETGLLSRWTRAPQRWGTVYRPARAWAYTRRVGRDPALHPIEGHLDLLQKAGGLSPRVLSNRMSLPAEAIQEARRLFAEWNVAVGRPILFIQPFSKVDQKNWPLDSYLTAARTLRDRGVQILFGGGPSEHAALEPVRQEGFVVAAGVPLLVSAGLVSLSRAVLGNDTGLLHLAVALGKRVVMIINSIGPGKCFPFGHPEWTVVPDNQVDVASVPPQLVIEACLRALAEANSMDEVLSGVHPAKSI